MVYLKTALDASGAPAPGARASFDLNGAPCASHLSVPANFVGPDADTMGFVTGNVHAASCDGLLLLDFVDTRHYAPVAGRFRHSWLHEVAATGHDVEPEVTRFVCNPLSGQLFRLPVPDMDVTKKSTGFGLLTQSEGSRGPPDRYLVAQQTGEWDELQLVEPSTMPAGRAMHIDHEVLAFGDRLWWVDVTWGACSVDPFSDRLEHRFIELPRGSVLPDLVSVAGKLMLGWYRRIGVSEGKLRYVEVSNTKKPFVISSF